MTPEQIAEPLSAEGFIGHKPLPDGRCEHRWRNRTTHIVRCRYADGWHAGQVAALLAAIPAKPDDEERELEALVRPTDAQWVQEALVDVVAEAWDLNLEAPDLGDGDPLSDLDDALGTLAERLGLAHSQSSEDLRAALAEPQP